jgi:hypothetical protein
VIGDIKSDLIPVLQAHFGAIWLKLQRTGPGQPVEDAACLEGHAAHAVVGWRCPPAVVRSGGSQWLARGQWTRPFVLAERGLRSGIFAPGVFRCLSLCSPFSPLSLAALIPVARRSCPARAQPTAGSRARRRSRRRGGRTGHGHTHTTHTRTHTHTIHVAPRTSAVHQLAPLAGGAHVCVR